MGLDKMNCEPCKGGTPPLSEEKENDFIKQVSDWLIVRDGVHKIHKEFKFATYKAGLEFARDVGELAEIENHHPVITIFYKRVSIELHTHAVQGLSENDFIMAAKISGLLKEGN